MNSLSIDLPTIWSNLLLLGSAYVLALPIAFDREKSSRSAGLRTYPLVAMGACGLMLIGINVLTDTGAESRVMQAIITGMGFIGGGAILKGDGRVTGLATASSLWVTGAIGISVAWQRFEIAITLAVMTFITLALVGKAKDVISDDSEEKTPD